MWSINILSGTITFVSGNLHGCGQLIYCLEQLLLLVDLHGCGQLIYCLEQLLRVWLLFRDVLLQVVWNV